MAKLLNIITVPEPSLRERSKELEESGIRAGDFQELCRDMGRTMLEKDGVGLAAPQIGRNIRVIVVNTKDGTACLINPRLTKKSLRKEWGEEGCLSVPDVYGRVKRHRRVKCEYLDKQGRKKTVQADGLLARILQHEIDHLDGVLFIDKAKDVRETGKSGQ